MNLSIGYEKETDLAYAQQLAAQLNLVIDNQAHQQLIVCADKLVLKINSFSPLFADFRISIWQKRRDAGKKQGLVRACKPGPGVRIVDATAGWGRDAAVLASFGAEVVMLERNPVMATLLADALVRRDEHSKNCLKLSLVSMDATHYLQGLSEKDYPDVVYIDPMHPQRQKTALVKKEMQALQQLIGVEEEAQALVNLAVSRALKRVVVKWPQQQSPLMDTPISSISGKTVRFDIYAGILT